MYKSLTCLAILGALTFFFSCSNLNTNNDNAQVVCGESLGQNYAFVQIDGAPAVDAFLLKDDHIKPALFTSKGCIAVAPEDKNFQLMVRDHETKNIGLPVDLRLLPPGVMHFRMSADSSMNRFTTEIKCPASTVVVAHEFLPILRRFESNHVIFPLAVMTITNENREAVMQRNLVLGSELAPVPLNLPDGTYSVELRGFDAFDLGGDRSVPSETCVLKVDSRMPTLALKTNDLTLIDGHENAVKVSPGARLDFAIGDQNASEVFLCLKRREQELMQADSCVDGEYKGIGDFFYAPDQGAWDLYAYARDSAGNRSEVMHKTFFVYHDTVIAEIRSLSRSISNYVQTYQELKAFKTYQRLVGLARTLVLKTEIADVTWQLLGHYIWLSTNKRLIDEKHIPGADIDQTAVAISPFNSDWAVSNKWSSITGNEGAGSYLFVDNHIVKLKAGYYEFEFVDQDHVVGIKPRRQEGTSVEERTILDVFEHGKLIDSLEFSGRIDSITVDRRSHLLILGDTSRIELVDFNDGYVRKPPVPFPLTIEIRQSIDLTLSSDSSAYFASYRDTLVRIDADTKVPSIFIDPGHCKIDRYQAISKDEVYYTTEPNASSNGACGTLGRIVWNDGQPIRQSLGPDDQYDAIGSFLVSLIDRKPFLFYFRNSQLYQLNLNVANAAPTDLMAPLSGILHDHPQEPDTIYVTNQNHISRLKLRQKPNPRDDRETLTFESNGRNNWLPLLGSKPQEFFLFGSDRVERFSFVPSIEIADQPLKCTYLCIASPNHSYAVEWTDFDHMLWADFRQNVRKVIHLEKYTQVLVMDDGDVIASTIDKKAWHWSAKTSELQEIGRFDLDRFEIGYYPMVDLLTLSSAQIGGVKAASTGEITFILHRNNGSWAQFDEKRLGLPLAGSALSPALPVLPLLRLDGNAVWVEVVNQGGEVLNSIKLISQTDFKWRDLNLMRSCISIYPAKTLLVSSCFKKLQAFDLYTGIPEQTQVIPDGYTAGDFDGLDWIALNGVDPADRMRRMNVHTGELSDARDLIKPVVVNGATVLPNGTFRDRWGETFEYQGYRLYETDDPFTVAYYFNSARISQLSTARSDPDWIDAQLKKSPLYDTNL